MHDHHRPFRDVQGLAAGRGVTLLEVLITVGVAMMLAAIAIPALRAAAMRVHDAKNQSSLRSTHQQFREYANDHDDYFLNAGRPDAPDLPVVVDFGPGNGWMAFPYMTQIIEWPSVASLSFGEAFATWHSTHDRAEHEGGREPGGIGNPRFARTTKFVYSEAMLADPFRFTSAGIAGDFAAHRRVRWSEVAYASCKGLMFDTARPQSTPSLRMANASFVDGSAEAIDVSMPPPAVPGVEWEGVTVLATPMGVLGRDVVR